MSIHPVSLDGAFTGDRKEAISPAEPANDNGRGLGRERFPKVEDIVDRLTNNSRVVDPQAD